MNCKNRSNLYALTTVPTDYLPTSPRQIGVRANVTDKTVHVAVHRAYLQLARHIAIAYFAFTFIKKVVMKSSALSSTN